MYTLSKDCPRKDVCVREGNGLIHIKELTDKEGLYEAPVAFLQEKFHLGRIPSVVIIGAIGAVISVIIQPWTSQWMDLVSVFICPLGAVLAGVVFFWVLKKETALAAVNEGRTAGKKSIDSWFYPLGKYGYCLLALIALVGGAASFLITGSSIG